MFKSIFEMIINALKVYHSLAEGSFAQGLNNVPILHKSHIFQVYTAKKTIKPSLQGQITKKHAATRKSGHISLAKRNYTGFPWMARWKLGERQVFSIVHISSSFPPCGSVYGAPVANDQLICIDPKGAIIKDAEGRGSKASNRVGVAGC